MVGLILINDCIDNLDNVRYLRTNLRYLLEAVLRFNTK